QRSRKHWHSQWHPRRKLDSHSATLPNRRRVRRRKRAAHALRTTHRGGICVPRVDVVSECALSPHNRGYTSAAIKSQLTTRSSQFTTTNHKSYFLHSSCFTISNSPAPSTTPFASSRSPACSTYRWPTSCASRSPSTCPISIHSPGKSVSSSAHPAAAKPR